MNKIHSYFLAFCLTLACGCAHGPRLDPSNPDDRVQMVDAYLLEFCSPELLKSQIGEAIHEVMMRMPADALAKVLDRRRPVLFTEMYDAGTARFASSSEIIVTERDEPAFQDGLTVLKLSTALNNGPKEAVKGIVAHELAHRVLDHVRRGQTTCKAEREANRLIKSWGFEVEYKSASEEFGAKKEGSGSASCQE
jgi:hypothetical protein